MNEKQAKRLRRECKETYGVAELVSKYSVDQRTLRRRGGPDGWLTGSIHLTGIKAIYKQAKKNANRGNYVFDHGREDAGENSGTPEKSNESISESSAG